ncbi:Putative calcineurin-like phosphoesterase domain, ApaH type, 5'-Nucleotidase/apyrase [Septoria linicola]|uniref:Calcineurin-like phosphoesterase domain, ApaH type, 5'-Nucleotidase/apyrase n=1 Tax=Septoria linicola TaxID=215465 RepID=A0A9Q9AV16_9PEZI|nr:putative calcineurin-like phosphoesterase domain, ApaH type, 5'-Nucleotidase/apyrase [Septoria linicola]USW55655.1 Putative calcineurin-like phosphoesterase domain, ApaH type, 5'-Nucleotidase/apyrase [Septoria linicola]
MAFHRIPLLLTLLHFATAEQPSAPSPIAAPLRELPWGQLNFLHTTDTHGWHGGHLQEAQYSADWGDYISFAHHLHSKADKDGSDLLLIDTGDRVEGNGLYDASDPKGKYTFDVVKHQAIDVMTVGNHELYKQNTSVNEYNKVVPDFSDAYIASNLDIFSPKTGEQVPLAKRFRKFTTKNQGIRIVAFGYLFNFKGNANNTVVKPVEDTLKEQWFKDAIADREVDLFLVAGHVPVRDTPEFEAVYKAIRETNWDAPIVFFGGHTHIRDYRKFDKKAWGLESGRYMETLGFLSMDGLSTGKKDIDSSKTKSLDYRRSYIDNNLFSLHHHSGTNKTTFNTELGKNVSEAISEARKDLKLDQTFGCAPHDYWLSRAPYPAEDSLLTLLETKVLPDTLNNTKTPTIAITNSGAIRFDIFKGPFTIDSTFVVSPFTSGFRVLKDVPYKAASKVLGVLNNQGPILLADLLALEGENQSKLHELLPHHPVRASSLLSADEAPSKLRPLSIGPSQIPLGSEDQDTPQVPGYTTKDDAGTDGDDTIHQPIRFYNVPNVIGTNVSFPSVAAAGPETVDLVYNEFIENWVLLALRYLGEKREVKDASPAIDGKTLTDVISGWVHKHWACEG